MKPRVAIFAGLILASSAAPLRSETKLEGEYQFLIDDRKQDRPYEWDYDSNNNDTFNNVQLRLFSAPYPGVEAFLKAEADWNSGDNNTPRPHLRFREAHLRFRREFGKRGVDSYVFTRQNRYWVENHLLQVVEDGNINGGGNAQGVRLDTWGFAGLHTAFVFSDFSGLWRPTVTAQDSALHSFAPNDETDDAYVARVWRPFMGDKLRLGLTFNRKNERESSKWKQPLQFTEVWAVDSRLTLFDVDYRLEISRGRENTLTALAHDGSLPENALEWRLRKLSLSDPHAAFPDDIVLRAEARAFRFGTPRLGFLNVAPSVWLLGPEYRNQLGRGTNDEKGAGFNSWYLLPGRAITLTTNFYRYSKEFSESKDITDFYQEIYTEYVHGFTTKFAYKRHHEERFFPDTQETSLSRNDDLFGEVVVENTLAWLRVQGRIKDLDTVFKKDLLSIETSVNVSRSVKIYNRFTFANDPSRQRKGLFSELQYRPTANVELFLSYGPFWMGASNDPVKDGNLESSGDQRDLVRLLLKGNF